MYYFTGVYLELNGNLVPNFAVLGHNQIDTSDDPTSVGGNLVCRTDNTSCCRGADNPNGRGFGDWFYPGVGVAVFPYEVLPSGPIYRQQRGAQVVRLRRDNNSTFTANGIYRCEVADQNGVMQTRYVGLYSEGVGEYLFAADLGWLASIQECLLNSTAVLGSYTSFNKDTY